MKRKLALTTATVALTVGSLAGMTAPAATAAPAAATAAVPADSPVKPGHTMTKDVQGRKVAKVTFTQVNGHVVQGWLEKLSKDKVCAQVMVKWYKGGKLRDTDLSEKVCRKGQKKYFSMRAGDKHHFNASDLWVGYKLS